jgi:UDP-N-acetyl-D-mannosaminuronate dehydrogenase
MRERIAVVGLGYVGLPIAMAFARRFEKTIGFDLNVQRVESSKRCEELLRSRPSRARHDRCFTSSRAA